MQDGQRTNFTNNSGKQAVGYFCEVPYDHELACQLRKQGFNPLACLGERNESRLPILLVDAVVANPPFSAEWSAADKFNNDDRFSKAGRLAPKKTADYAFILHMIYHLNEGGTMACVAPHGVLFRGNAEGVIRRFLIEKKNYIDAIIGLPANIFYGTSIPTCILVMKKCRKEDDNILFIDASKEFEKVKTQNKLRPQHIQKIVETYRDRKEIEKYSHLATLQEVADNDYNLNIPRYVDTFEEEEPIDIKAVMAEIKELEAKRAELDKEIDVYLKELGIVD